MATDRHKQQLAAYLSHHKGIISAGRQNGTQNKNSKHQVGNVHSSNMSRHTSTVSSITSGKSSAIKSTISSRSARQMPKYTGAKRIGKATFQHLPDEIMLKIFGYLDVLSLLRCARVSKRWCNLATDNLLWQSIFKRYVTITDPRAADEAAAQKLPASYWKTMCIKKCSEWRNKRALRQLKKRDAYTGLPKQTKAALCETGVRYQLSLVDSQHREHTTDAHDVFWHSMTACVRWFTLDFLPLRQVRGLRILACCPLFYDTNGKAVPGSPYQRSLMWECDMRLSDYTTDKHAIGSDNLITLYRLPGDLLLATWKADGEIAFIGVGLHYDHLVKRSLLGTSSECYSTAEHKVIADDIDSTYGLHSYTATVELRNMRQELWSRQFTNFHCRAQSDGTARFPLIRPNITTDHCHVNKKITMPWRTELFKGMVEMTGWLDITILDERGEVFFASSSPVHADKPPVTGSDFEYGQEHDLVIKHVSDRVTIDMQLGQVDDGRIFVTNFELIFPLTTVNDWFGTKY